MAGIVGLNMENENLLLCFDFASRRTYSGTGSTIYDISGNDNHGTLVNSPTFDTNKIILSATSLQYLTHPIITISNKSFTLEFVGNMNGPIDLDNRRGIFSDGNIGEMSNNNTFFKRFILDGNLSNNNIGGLVPIITATTFHWLLSFDYSSKTFYHILNGVEDETPNTTLSSYSLIETSFDRFGRSTAGSRYYDGDLYMMRIYDKYMDENERYNNYQALKSRFGI